MADRVAIIDHGKLVAMGTVEEIKKKAGTPTLEDAFINLTGHAIRDEDAGPVEHLRQRARAWGRR